jgi:flagellar biogenesis protein FliO
MNDVGLGELLVRMVVSLLVVLGLVLGAYAILRRRQGLPSGRELRGGRDRGAGRTSLIRSRSGGSTKGGLKGGNKRGLKIVGRVGVGRTSSVIAVQFADRVFMLGTSEQGPPTVLAELDIDRWTEATETPEDLQPIVRAGGAGTPGTPGAGDRRPSILDALREATTRRG